MNCSAFFRTLLIAPVFLAACNNATQTEATKITPADSTAVATESPVFNKAPQVAGSYADEGYAKRKEGYDWVAVQVQAANDQEITVTVRSRTDLKKPTCTADFSAKQVTDSSFEASYEGKPILFVFSDTQMSIRVTNETDEGLLHYFCSGGAALGGPYTKLSETLQLATVKQ